MKKENFKTPVACHWTALGYLLTHPWEFYSWAFWRKYSFPLSWREYVGVKISNVDESHFDVDKIASDRYNEA